MCTWERESGIRKTNLFYKRKIHFKDWFLDWDETPQINTTAVKNQEVSKLDFLEKSFFYQSAKGIFKLVWAVRHEAYKYNNNSYSRNI